MQQAAVARGVVGCDMTALGRDVPRREREDVDRNAFDQPGAVERALAHVDRQVERAPAEHEARERERCAHRLDLVEVDIGEQHERLDGEIDRGGDLARLVEEDRCHRRGERRSREVTGCDEVRDGAPGRVARRDRVAATLDRDGLRDEELADVARFGRRREHCVDAGDDRVVGPERGPARLSQELLDRFRLHAGHSAWYPSR